MIPTQKVVSPEAKKSAALHLQTTFKMSKRRACRVISLPRATKRYVDVLTKESPDIKAPRSLPGQRVVNVLNRLAFSHGKPGVIILDSGAEIISKVLDQWA